MSLSSPRHFLERQDLRARLNLIKVIAPELHHLPPFVQVGRTVVSAAVRIAYSVRKLVLDVLRADVEHLVEYRAGHGPEAVAGHLIRAVSHAPQRGEDRVVAHRALISAGAREHVLAASGQRLEGLQHLDSLA